MAEVILALRRSLATLGRGRVWGYILAPALIALLAIVALSLFLLQRLIELLLGQPPID